MTIQSQFEQTLNLLHEYESKYHRDPDSVKLLAVSKGQTIEKIRAVYQCGQKAFGENYLQEALAKITTLSALQIEWHFIGSIQSNKTKKIAEHFSWVHCVTDARIAKRLNDQRPETLPPLNICLEVNISNESSKAGIHPDETLALAQYCLTLPRLHLRGLMAIPEPQKDFAAQCIVFHKLFLLNETLRLKNIFLDTLSMGMSDDFEAAIAEGATIIRLGTRVFGERS